MCGISNPFGVDQLAHPTRDLMSHEKVSYDERKQSFLRAKEFDILKFDMTENNLHLLKEHEDDLLKCADSSALFVANEDTFKHFSDASNTIDYIISRANKLRTNLVSFSTVDLMYTNQEFIVPTLFFSDIERDYSKPRRPGCPPVFDDTIDLSGEAREKLRWIFAASKLVKKINSFFCYSGLMEFPTEKRSESENNCSRVDLLNEAIERVLFWSQLSSAVEKQFR